MNTYLQKQKEFIDLYGELGKEVLDYCGHFEDARRLLEEECEGEFKDLAEWAENLIEDTYELRELPPVVRFHIDWQSIAHDLLIDDYIEFHVNGIYHIFRRI